MRFLGSINLFSELGAVEIGRLVCSFLNRSEFLVNQFELINLLQRSTKPLLSVYVFGFVVRGCLVLKLVAETQLVFEDSALVSLRFHADIFCYALQVEQSLVCFNLHLLFEVFSSLEISVFVSHCPLLGSLGVLFHSTPLFFIVLF